MLYPGNGKALTFEVLISLHLVHAFTVVIRRRDVAIVADKAA